MGPGAFEVGGGNEWIHGTTLWRVSYEFADPDGGGFGVDYFKTANRFTPPTGPEIKGGLDGPDLTVIGIEKIESFTTDTPESLPSQEAWMLEDSRHRRIFDVIGDSAG